MTWSGAGARSWLLAGCPYPNDVSKETNAISIKVLAHFLPPFHDVLQSAIETAQNMKGKHQEWMHASSANNAMHECTLGL